jgi:hypothetical protein
MSVGVFSRSLVFTHIEVARREHDPHARRADRPDDDLPDGAIVGDLTATATVRDAALSVVASEGR